jgi:hypothetical protein
MALSVCHVCYKLIEYHNVLTWLERRYIWHRYALVSWQEESKPFLWSLWHCPFQYILPEATGMKAADSLRALNVKVILSSFPLALQSASWSLALNSKISDTSTIEWEVTSKIIRTVLNAPYLEVQWRASEAKFGDCASEDRLQFLVY